MPSYQTRSGTPVTPEMATFLRTIENRQCFLFAGGGEIDLAQFAACAGISVTRTLHYIEQLAPEYLEIEQH